MIEGLFLGLFQQLRVIYEQFGILWALMVFVTLGITVFAGYPRAVMWTMFVLLCTQVWYWPVYAVSRLCRWPIVAVVLLRGILQLRTLSGAPWETRTARNVMLALAALALVSASWTTAPGSSLAIGASFSIGIVLVFVVLWRVQDRIDLPARIPAAAVLLGFWAFGGGLLVAVIATLADDWDLIRRTGSEGRFSGVFINPNMAGLLAAGLFPFVLAANRAYLGQRAMLRIPALVFLAITVFRSGSRSAIIGTLLAVLLITVYRRRMGAFLLLAVAGVAISSILLYAPLDNVDQSMFGHITRTKHLNTLSGRLELWETGWDAVRDSPILGLGWSASRFLGGEFDTDTILEQGTVYGASNLHSAHVQIFVDLGLVGLGLFWAFCLLFLRAGWRMFRAPRSPRNELVVIIFASGVGMLADTFVHGGVFSIGSPTAIVFWSFCTVVLKEADRVRATERWTPPAPAPAQSVPAPRAAWIAPRTAAP